MRLNIKSSLILILFSIFLVSAIYGCGETTTEETSLKVPVEGQEDVEEIVVVEGEEETPLEEEPEVRVTTHFIDYTKDGFSPKLLTILVGDTVTFRNTINDELWPASTVHPRHRDYPGSGIEKCGSEEQNKIFDACRKFRSGGTYSFTFNEVGKWSYHNHIRSLRGGSIIVTDF